ncbi:decarboxylating 6-phosphogluconate dehydrogenase [Candidatus Woesearchaeota archaeon]|nr:decarboxylating 6-phosphogluconate dehydrogenase [Candidatus Woesearchaeota archaeon]HIH37568.1 decarboxylating 6-phosphogluconate dehydrogenase [Candidatus Woesearchaeota archaeon]HIH47981.1 decarboxylating 6-phosphogluconate dehydrogenase [Candidatus Woesearchaeota archaeon]HIJ03691.1 decarboxylating 6-phosphogluconate dehydrogenase [Candidatus Woesearchaeota archaeon]
MEMGFIGLGRMGMHMVKRLLAGKIKVVVWNRSADKVKEAERAGAVGSSSIKELIGKLPPRKIVWLMLPSGEVTEQAFKEVLSLLKKDDIIIDGANSNFHDSIRRHEEAAKKDVRMLDVGVSGGLKGAETGYGMMVGGKKETYETVLPAIRALAIPEGFGLVGPGGSGHYVKMIHNAIEYGMMQAIAEGFDLLENGRFKDIDEGRVSHIWNHGCIISSFLMEMAELALDKGVVDHKPYVEDNGEGKWAAIEAMEHAVPFVVNSYALHARYLSRDDDSFAFKLLAGIRNEFGGHAIKK